MNRGKGFDVDEEAIKFYSNKNNNIFNNSYHFQAPFGLINDPNGLSYFNSEYNIFFQWNPFSCEHKYKHWGIVTTKDFINYTIPKIALEPREYYDKDGCYSGSSIEKDGQLEILYTGNVKRNNGERLSYQCRAIMDKKHEIKKLGPVVASIPDGYTSNFRDPKIYLKNGIYYFVIGAQTKKLKGRVLLYSSLDMINWVYEGEIKTYLEEFGYMWECPNIFTLKNRDILLFSPQGLKKEEFKYQNIYQSGYIIGELDYDTLKFSHGNFIELDMGFDFYAPQVFQDYKGRIIVIGWMGVPEEYEKNHESLQENWIHCLTMPRELVLQGNKIYQKPVSEIKLLRGDKCFKKENFSQRYLEFSNINENSYEVTLDINKKNTVIKIEIYKGTNEYFECNISDKVGFISRENIINGPKGIRKFKINDRDNIKINIFVDKSAIEIYINDGEIVLSSRVFAKDNSTGFRVEGLDELLSINNLEIWKLKEIKYSK
ncbi:MAG: sucrose-6-phosphate hydrolase [Clostridium perfringens]|nr:sucrose-6-phosphate hydrolase [Clostridium perfringens]